MHAPCHIKVVRSPQPRVHSHVYAYNTHKYTTSPLVLLLLCRQQELLAVLDLHGGLMALPTQVSVFRRLHKLPLAFLVGDVREL